MEKRDNRNKTLEKILQALDGIVVDSKVAINEMIDEFAALMGQKVSKELSWKQERKELLKERDSSVSTMLIAINHLESLTTELEHARAQQKLLDVQCKEMEGKVRGKEEEVCSLQESLLFQKMETERIKTCMRAKQESFTVMEQDLLRRLIPIHEFLKHEEAFKREWIENFQELQEQNRQTVEKWLANEEEWRCKMGKVEEEMMHVIKQNIQLQELALKTDKEKAKLKKEEKRAKQGMEKKLKKERKRREEEEEKVKSQRAKKENLE